MFDSLIEERVRVALDEAQEARSLAPRLWAFARGDREVEPPTEREVQVFARATGARGSSDAARIVRACIARLAVRDRRPVAAADLAAAAGFSRQYATRQYGSLVAHAVASRVLEARGAR